MAAQRFRHGTNFAITTVSLFAILAVVNLFSYRHFVRWDLTRNKEFTVSATTRELLAGLDNIINIKVYLSKDLPAALLTFERQLRDLLAEYETYGRGKLRIEYIAPANDPVAQRELMFQGIRPQGVLVLKRDQRTQVDVYNSIVVQFQDKKELIPSLLDEGSREQSELISNFEYLLTSKIFKVRRTGRDVIGWATNSPDIQWNRDYAFLRKQVQREWDVLDVRLDPPNQIPFTVSVLVLAAPKDLTPAQLFEIDQYVMRGGKLLALVETYNRQLRNEGLEALVLRPSNITQLLERYGVRVKSEVALDGYPFCALAPINRFPMPYEFWVNAMGPGLNRQHPAMSRLDRITLPWTQTLEAATSMPAGVRMTPLAWTSPRSIVRWGNRIAPAPQAPTTEQSTKGATHTLIAALTGTFPSYFAEGTSYPLDAGTTMPQTGRTRPEDRKYLSPETQMVVVGNAFFLQDGFLRMCFEQNNNIAFFQNVIEWMALGKGLGDIRVRHPLSRTLNAEILKEANTALRNRYKILGTFAMPALVVVAGVLYNTVRRRRRRAWARRLLSGGL
ncbi:MAG: GldG family protein [Candidatus Sumerlaeia bacterium]|nr:GldG family protein [Candidatus Sumerlaeia bacterium]